MSTTFGNLKTRVAEVLLDPNARTFTSSMVEELIQRGLVEVGRILPEQFTEDIDLVSHQITYTPRIGDFGAAVPDIDVKRVEVWDTTTDIENFIARIPPAAQQPVAGQDAGWYVWSGVLYLPTRFVASLDSYLSSYVLRVWGYSPYVPPNSDDDIIDVSAEAEHALIMYIHLDSLRMLLNDRNLFTQWQTRSGNVDTSLAGLANEKNIAASEWRTYSRSIARLRSDI